MPVEGAVTVEPAGLEALEANHSLLQSRFWAEFRSLVGWEARAFRCRAEGLTFTLLVLVRPLPLGLRLAYVPHGPEAVPPQTGREDFLAALAAALRPHLAGCLFMRYDLPWGGWGEGKPPEPLRRGRGLRKAPVDIQPPNTVILDLGYEEESLLAAMKSKTRYNIGLAAKKGVRVEEGSAADLPAWYELYRETARRDRITLHSFEYYRRQFEFARAGGGMDADVAPQPRMAAAAGGGRGAPEMKLLLARHEGELLAGIIVALHGRAATYLYGASSDAKRNLMPAYALQWEAIRLARRRGCQTYDLFGIPPSPDPGHPMHGLYRFKTGFGGRVFNRLGCWDVVYNGPLYAAFALAERVRAWYFLRFRKRL